MFFFTGLVYGKIDLGKPATTNYRAFQRRFCKKNKDGLQQLSDQSLVLHQDLISEFTRMSSGYTKDSSGKIHLWHSTSKILGSTWMLQHPTPPVNNQRHETLSVGWMFAICLLLLSADVVFQCVIREHRGINIMRHQCILAYHWRQQQPQSMTELGLVDGAVAVLLSALAASFHRNLHEPTNHQQHVTPEFHHSQMQCTKAWIDFPGPKCFFCHGMFCFMRFMLILVQIFWGRSDLTVTHWCLQTRDRFLSTVSVWVTLKNVPLPNWGLQVIWRIVTKSRENFYLGISHYKNRNLPCSTHLRNQIIG